MSGLGGGRLDVLGRGCAAFKPLGGIAWGDFAEMDALEITSTNEIAKKYSLRRRSVKQRSSIIKQTDIAGKITCSSPIGEILKYWFQSSGVVAVNQSAGSLSNIDLNMINNGWVDVDPNADEIVGKSFMTNVLILQKVGQDFTADDTTDVITITGHGYANGDRIRVSNAGGALPAGLAADTTYFVLNVTANTFQVSLSLNGAVVDITDAGTGTHTAFIEYELNRDYAVTENRAMVFAIPGEEGGRIDTARGATGETVVFSCDFPEQNQARVDWLDEPDLRGTMLYIGDSPTGAKQEWQAQVQLRPTGPINWVGDDIQTFELEFDVLQLDPTKPFGTYLDRSGLSLPAPK